LILKNDNSIIINIHPNSDMEIIFIKIKYLINLDKYIAESIYSIHTGENCEKIYTKQKINYFKRIDFDEFIEN
jgi:hypothetical protein